MCISFRSYSYDMKLFIFLILSQLFSQISFCLSAIVETQTLGFISINFFLLHRYFENQCKSNRRLDLSYKFLLQ